MTSKKMLVSAILLTIFATAAANAGFQFRQYYRGAGGVPAGGVLDVGGEEPEPTLTYSASISPNPYVFPNTLEGGSISNTFTLSNTGTGPLSLAALAVGGADSSNFVINAGSSSCTIGTSLSSGGSCTISVSFNPDIPVAYTASLDVVGLSNSVVVSQNLSGQGNPIIQIGSRFVSSIPRMTAASSGGYTASASSTWDNGPYWQPWYAFSANASGVNYVSGAVGGWLPAVTAVALNSTYSITPQWLRIDLPTAQVFSKVGFNMMDTQYGYPVDFQVQGSNDGSTWTPVLNLVGLTGASYTFGNADAMSVYNFTNPGSYSKYRVYITKVRSGGNSWDNGVYFHDISFQ